LLRAYEWSSFVRKYGQEGVSHFFTGTPERLIAQWCVWNHEYLEDEAADVDRETAQLKKIVDGLIEESPAGVQREAENTLWYKEVLAPAAERSQTFFNTKAQKEEQIGAIWGDNWNAVVNPGVSPPFLEFERHS
jgi:hypothetical protein